MHNLFIFSNAFNARIFIHNIDYILNFEIKNVILLEENHSIFEKFTRSVIIYKTIDECLANCDTILIINSSNIPQIFVQYIESHSKKYNKKCYILENESNSFELPQLFIEKTKTLPLIFSFTIGKEANMFELEMVLNKLFITKNIKIIQIYTEQTLSWIKQLNEQAILNDKIKETWLLSDKGPESSIAVYSMQLMDDVNKLKDLVDTLYTFSPDFIIFQTDIRFSKYKEISQILYSNFKKHIDFTIQSDFFLYDDRFKVYCPNNGKKDNRVVGIEHETLEMELYSKIYQKLAFPTHIFPL